MIWDEGLEAESATYKLASSDSRIIRSVAGPGSGKSFAIKRRIIRLLETGTNPEKILAITFTRNAAADLRKEISMINIKGYEKVTARTVHSHALMILHRSEINTIISRTPRMVIEHEIKPALRDIEFPPDTTFSDREDMLKTYESAWANNQTDKPGIPRNETEEEFANRLIDWLKYHQGMLVGEVIPIALRYLQDNPASPEIGKYDIILVDEYQDLNRAEQEFIKLLSGNKNIVIVGDDDQSIYSFKHAHPEGIREFPNTHPYCNEIDFDHCRRCPKRVVKMATRLINENSNRTLGDLQVFSENQDGIVEIIQWKTLDDEIRGISQKVSREIIDKHIKPEDVLILAPVRRIGYKIRDELVKNNINAKSYFKETAICTDELKYSFSLLALIANQNDMVSLRYLLGCGDPQFRTKSYLRLLEYSKKNNISIFDVLNSVIEGEIKISNISAITKQYKEIIIKIKHIKDTLKDNRRTLVDLLAEDTVENNDFRSILIEAIEESENEQQNELDDWIKKIYSYATDRISFPENVTKQDHVRVMSLYASKGLSAKYVVVMSAIEELIPKLDKESEISINKQLEEQRRLFYVAITRCKSSNSEYPGTLIISSFVMLPGNEALTMKIEAKNNTWRKVITSRFIRDFEETAPEIIKGQ